jgi:predicted Zn-dependent peptidase
MPPEIEKPVTTPEFVYNERLSNGLEIFVHEMPKAEFITAHMFVKAGPRYEEEHNLGVSHYCEHWLSDGSRRFKTRQEIEEALLPINGEWDAATTNEYVEYYITVPQEYVSFSTEFLREIVFNPLLTDEAFERERGIITRETLQYLDTPDSYIETLISRQMYKDHPLGRGYSGLGTFESIRTMKTQTARDHYAHFYRPDNMILVIAGNIDKESAFRYAQKSFKDLPRKVSPDLTMIHHSYNPESNVSIEQKDINQVYLRFAFIEEGLAGKSTLSFPSLILATILTEHIFYTLITELGLAYSAGCSEWRYSDTGLIIAQAETSPDNLSDVAQHFVRLINTLPLTYKKVAMAKNRIIQEITNLRGTDEMADFIGGQYIDTGKILSPDQMCDAFDSVTLDTLHETKNRLFTKKNLGVILYGPVSEHIRSDIDQMLKFE